MAPISMTGNAGGRRFLVQNRAGDLRGKTGNLALAGPAKVTATSRTT